MSVRRIPWLMVLATATLCSVAMAQEAILLEADSFTISLTPDGRVAQILDKACGVDHFDNARGGAFASFHRSGKRCPSTSARFEGDLLTLTFAECNGEAVFRVTPGPRRLTFEVVSFSCEDVEELYFAQIPLTLRGDLSEPFGVSPLALNIKTNCHEIPGLNSSLSGFVAYRRFGFVGTSGAVVACPPDRLREALKDAVRSSPDIAWSPLGGPWALDSPLNQGSYLISMDEYVTEENVGKWIAAARATGVSQIDFHGGKAFRWGDFEVSKEIYPRGRDSLKAVVDAVHEAGLYAGLHTYAFFIAKDSPWVTPVPDSRLAYDTTFTLDSDIEEGSDTITVVETTEAMTAITGFQVRNSATLRLGDELITYTGASRQAPYVFTGCVRGANGTQVARHPKGTKAYHLKECFGLFVPQGDSTLYTDVARSTADLYDACGFDLLYLDALDGSDILEGGRNAWHYDARFVDELVRSIRKPAVIETSTFSHHLWRARSRMQSWDCGQREVKAFVDCHVAHNRQWKAAFLPTHLGWWGCFDWLGVQPERTFPDDVEYVCAKALATDSSLSYLAGFSPAKIAHGNGKRLAAISKRYETLRSKGDVPESIKEKLATPRQDFTLTLSDDGTPLFRPTVYSKHLMPVGGEPQKFTVANPYSPQPLRLRIEAGLSPAGYDSPESKLLTDFNSPEESWKAEIQQGVTAELQLPDKDGMQATLVARNGQVDSYRAWAAFHKEFPTPISLQNMGLGLWVDGDGQGEILNVQPRSPIPLGGGLADHYIRIDFTGSRYFRLIEPETEAMGEYEWAHTRRLEDMLKNPLAVVGTLYSMYHVWMDYNQIGTLTLGINNLPQGRPVKVGIGPIRALSISAEKLVNPSIKLGGDTLTFLVELCSGQYMEYLGPDDCKVYDEQGECRGSIVAKGTTPEMMSGPNFLGFAWEEQTTTSGNARLTVIMSGEPLYP